MSEHRRRSNSVWPAVALAAVGLVASAAACGDESSASPPGAAAGNNPGGAAGQAGNNPGGGSGGQGVDCSTLGANGDVYKRLSPSCESCHGKGASKPYFASLQSFEDTLVYNAALVTPGKPDQSRLMALLQGTATGNYPQMPLGSASFAELSNQQKTAISTPEIAAWISALQPRGAASSGPPASATLRRLSATELVASLDAAIGLTQADLFKPDNMPVDGRALLIQSPTALRASVAYSYNGAPERFERWQALGGGNPYLHQGGHLEVTPSLLQTLTQVSQARCRLAVDKKSNPVFFRSAGPDDASATASDSIKKNIGELARNVFAERIDASEIDSLYTRVFVPYEKAAGPRNGWVAVCSVLLRDPRFLFY